MYNVHLTHSLLCFEFVELTLIKGVGIEYTDNQIKAICTICVIGLCKASLNLSKRIEK